MLELLPSFIPCLRIHFASGSKLFGYVVYKDGAIHSSCSRGARCFRRQAARADSWLALHRPAIHLRERSVCSSAAAQHSRWVNSLCWMVYKFVDNGFSSPASLIPGVWWLCWWRLHLKCYGVLHIFGYGSKTGHHNSSFAAAWIPFGFETFCAKLKPESRLGIKMIV